MLIPEGFGQANLRFSGVGVPTGAEITFGFSHLNFVGSPADAAGVIGVSFAASNIDSMISSSVTMSSILVKFGPNSTGPSAEIATAVAGTGSADCESPQVSYLVRKLTSQGGRTGRGRFYLPGPPTAQVGGNGVIVALGLQNLQTGLDQWLLDLQAADLTPFLLHAETSPAVLPFIITEFEADGRVATQRRRMRR